MLIMICVWVRLTGEAVADNSTSEVGVFGQAILVSSRLGAYCGAAWRLLQDEGARHTDPDKASPLSHFCDVLKLLVRQRIIQCVQVWHRCLSHCTCMIAVVCDATGCPPAACLVSHNVIQMQVDCPRSWYSSCERTKQRLLM